MAARPHIFVVPFSPVFNPEEAPPFENLTRQDASLLRSALYLNYADMLSPYSASYDITYFLDEKDVPFIPEMICHEEISKYFIESKKCWNFIAKLTAKKIHEATSILILFSDTIGITPATINQYFNMLNYDDHNILIGKTMENNVSLLGINYFDEAIFSDLNSCFMKYDDMLKAVNKSDGFIFTVEGFQSVESLSHFRELYKILSKKESIEFCSHEIHEKFTELFIEYKDLLK
ncbi:MAG: hypothetical protein ACM3RX_08955 [Methanococcaceae archaeon]